MRHSRRYRHLQAPIDVLARLGAPARLVGQQIGNRPVCLHDNLRVLHRQSTRQRLLREAQQALFRAGRRQEAFFEREGVQQVVLGDRLRLRVAVGAGERVELFEERGRLLVSSHPERHDTPRREAGVFQPVRTGREDGLCGLFEETVGKSEIAARLMNVPGLQGPRLRLEERVVDRVRDLDHARHLGARVIDATLLMQQVPEAAARHDLSLRVLRRSKAIRGRAIQRLGRVGVAFSTDVAQREREPGVLPVLPHQRGERPGRVVPQTLLLRDRGEAIGRVVFVRLVGELLAGNPRTDPWPRGPLACARPPPARPTHTISRNGNRCASGADVSRAAKDEWASRRGCV